MLLLIIAGNLRCRSVALIERVSLNQENRAAVSRLAMALPLRSHAKSVLKFGLCEYTWSDVG
jgi:hypothetical protein